MKLSLRNRIVSSIVGGMLLVSLLMLRGHYLVIVGMAVAIIAVVEFNMAFKKAGYRPMTVVSAILAILTFVAFVWYSVDSYKFIVVISLLCFFTLLAYHVFSNHDIIDTMITLFSIFYVVAPIVLIMVLAKRTDMLLWLVFILAISTDISAFLIGKTLGRNKLIEEISPKKTIEGALGGLVGCILATLFFKLFAMPTMPIMHALTLGVLGAVVSQVGDLVASKIKRYCNIKDFGKIIPGHGGVLDRFDSILFTACLVFMYAWLFV